MGRTKRTDAQLQDEEVAIFECLIKFCGHHEVPAQIPQLPFNGRTANRVPLVLSGPLGVEIADTLLAVANAVRHAQRRPDAEQLTSRDGVKLVTRPNPNSPRGAVG